jgi:IS5 family transposase
MRPKPVVPESEDLFGSRLDQEINMRHALVRLAGLIDWSGIERTFTEPLTSGRGRPALAPRLIAGLLYLPSTHPTKPSSTLGSRTRIGCAGETRKE